MVGVREGVQLCNFCGVEMLEGNSYNDSCSKENNLHLQEKRLVCIVELLKKESVLERL